LRQKTPQCEEKRFMAPRGVAEPTVRRRVEKTAQKESTAKI
jgi:hypothetical protein